MLGIGWKDGVATIVDRRLVEKQTEPAQGEFAGQGYEVFEYIADVVADDGTAHFRGTLKEPHIEITFKPPAIGQKVKVKLHPKDRKVKFDRADDGTYEHSPGIPDWRRHKDPLKEADEAAVAAGQTAEAQARWEAQLNDAPGAPPASAVSVGDDMPGPQVDLGPGGMSTQAEDRVRPHGKAASMAEIVEMKKKVDSGEISQADFEVWRAGKSGSAGQ